MILYHGCLGHVLYNGTRKMTEKERDTLKAKFTKEQWTMIREGWTK